MVTFYFYLVEIVIVIKCEASPKQEPKLIQMSSRATCDWAVDPRIPSSMILGVWRELMFRLYPT